MESNVTGKKKIRIYYFSGTGNTAWVVHRMAERLVSLENEVEVVSCDHVGESKVDVSSCDMVGIAFPIHSSFAPKNFREFLMKFSQCEGKPLFAVTTAGYMAGDVLWYTSKFLEKKGYNPFLFGNIIMGNNLHLPNLSPLSVTKPEKMKQRLEKADRKIEKLAKFIDHQKSHKEGIHLLGRLLGISQRFVAGHFESLAFKGFHADDSCIECGWCVKNCPVGNIQLDVSGIVFQDYCILCMRCYSFCPRQAIQMTDKTTNEKKYVRYKGPKGANYPSNSKY